MDDQPSGVTLSPACGGMNKKFTNDTAVGQYETFIVPAECAYHMDIQIVWGNHKDKNFFLIPGCGIVADTDGTTTKNKWQVSVQWSDVAKERAKKNGVTLPEPPQDADGNKCGKLGNM